MGHTTLYHPWVMGNGSIVQCCMAHGSWVVQYCTIHGSWIVGALYNPWAMGHTTLYHPWVMDGATLYNPWGMETMHPSFVVQWCMAHGSWENHNYKVLYNPWGMGNASIVQPIVHGVFILLYGIVWPMGHGEKIAERCERWALDKGWRPPMYKHYVNALFHRCLSMTLQHAHPMYHNAISHPAHI